MRKDRGEQIQCHNSVLEIKPASGEQNGQTKSMIPTNNTNRYIVNEN